MKHTLLLLVAAAISAGFAFADPDPAYAETIQKWRAERENKLRADNGWLTLAARLPLKAGTNTLGVAADNDVVLPTEFKGDLPGRIGTLVVDVKAVTLKLADGVTMVSERDEGKKFSGDRAFKLEGARDWVGLGRMRMHVIESKGRFFLRVADNESTIRKNFEGCLWYPVDEKFKVEAKFLPAKAGHTISIVNVLDEVTQEPCAGTLQFQLGDKTHTLDALAEDDGLFIIFKDDTAGDTTYASSRFMMIEKRPKDNEMVTLDFNKAYNPPCSFSNFTTCPLPPKQNFLKVRIEAGEKQRK